MYKENYAAIDIGSNSARLLIKSISEGENGELSIERQQLVRVPLRLGFDVFSRGEISDIKTKRIVRLMKAFYQLMRIYEVKYYRACATSAMRDAKNSSAIIKKTLESTKIKIDLISGLEEAKIIYDNHIENQKSKKGSYIYVDVGGGSTEVNLLHDGELCFSMSYDIGTVRMLSGGIKDKTWTKLQDDLTRISQGIEVINIVGSGGNINRLYKLSDSKDLKEQTFPVQSLMGLHAKLSAMSPEQRIKNYKLKPDRADVIVPAADIFLRVAKIVNSEYIHVPQLGLSDGIIDDLYINKRKEYQFL